MSLVAVVVEEETDMVAVMRGLEEIGVIVVGVTMIGDEIARIGDGTMIAMIAVEIGTVAGEMIDIVIVRAIVKKIEAAIQNTRKSTNVIMTVKEEIVHEMVTNDSTYAD
jgi:hypothetical protein